MKKDRVADLVRIKDIRALSPDEVARLMAVDSKVALAWLAGGEIPLLYTVQLDKMLESLDRLVQMFEPKRLPEMLRRPAPVFADRAAIEIILQGGIEYVADAYERLLTYSA